VGVPATGRVDAPTGASGVEVIGAAGLTASTAP
jgi:hypothetical protein